MILAFQQTILTSQYPNRKLNEYYIIIVEKSGETKPVKFQMTIKKLLMIFESLTKDIQVF